MRRAGTGGNDGWLWWRWSRLRQRKLAAAVTLEAQGTAAMIVGGRLRATWEVEM